MTMHSENASPRRTLAGKPPGYKRGHGLDQRRTLGGVLVGMPSPTLPAGGGESHITPGSPPRSGVRVIHFPSVNK